MIRKKSRPQDELIILDETIDQVERASAASRLASDGFGKNIHPVLDQWLSNSQYILREEAISLLLGGFGFDRYINKAIDLLKNDPEWQVKCTAASALVTYVTYSEKAHKYEDKIKSELLKSLLTDANHIVQKRVYEYAYKMITGRSLFLEAYEFDRNQDVDWNLLQPYLEKYGLSKPE